MAAVLKQEPPTPPDYDAMKLDIERRQLTGTARAVLGAQLVDTLPVAPGRRALRAAAIVGSSEANINRARRIKRLDPALFARVETGEVTLSAAAVSLQGEPRSAARNAQRAAHIAELARRGASSLVIGEALGITAERVWQIAKRFGISLPKARNFSPADERVAEIARLAKDGNRVDQIAAALGLSESHVRRLATNHAIPLIDRVLGNTHRFKARKTIDNVVQGLAGEVVVIEAIKAAPFPDYDDTEREQLVESLTRSMRALQWLLKELRGDVR